MFFLTRCGGYTPLNHSFPRVWNILQLKIFRHDPLECFLIHIVRQNVSERTETQGRELQFALMIPAAQICSRFQGSRALWSEQSLEECQPAVNPKDSG